MSKQIEYIILELIIFIILGFLIYFIFSTGLDLGFIKIEKIEDLLNEINAVEDSKAATETEITNYTNTINTLESTKKSYIEEKQKYDSITEETLELIKKANTEETYTIEYIWINLSRYAEFSDLKITMVEPGGASDAIQTSDGPVEDPGGSVLDEETSKKLEENDTNSELDWNNTPEETSPDKELQILVEGSYLDVADFVFNVENDETLHFKLDDIDMKYKGDNKITASFTVKQLTVYK